MPTTDTLDLSVVPFYEWETGGWEPVAESPVLGIPIDSIFKAREESEPVYRESLLVRHTLKAEHDGYVARPQTGAPVWMFVVMVLYIILYYLYMSSRKLKSGEVLKSAVDHRVMERMIRGGNLGPARMMPMGLLVCVAIGTEIYWSAMRESGFLWWFLVSLGLGVVYMIRNGILRVIGSVLYREDAVEAYIESNYIYHFILSAILLPVLLLRIYMPVGGEVVQYVFWGLVVVEMVARLVRGVKLFLTKSGGFQFYLFYYLCTVELVPILVLMKWLIE